MKRDYDQLTKELFLHANTLAAMPLDEWMDELLHAENVAPFRDPTFFIKYMYSKKPEALKEVLSAAIALKHAVLKVQSLLHEELLKELEAHHPEVP